MTARLTSATLVSALTRRVGQAGGNAAILEKGDPQAGAILLICAERGRITSVRERLLGVDGVYNWNTVGPAVGAESAEIQDYLARRRARDPDMWLVELDIANAERFAAETISTA